MNYLASRTSRRIKQEVLDIEAKPRIKRTHANSAKTEILVCTKVNMTLL